MKITRQRSRRGSLMFEMSAALPMFITMTALCLDTIFGVMAYVVLDETSVDAARAASMGRGAKEASLRAIAVAKSHERAGIVPTVEIKEYNTKNGDYLAGPYLRLETSVKFKLPFPIIIFSQSITPKPMELKRTYAYPILPVVLPDED